MDESQLKNYTKRVETISVPYLTAEGQAAGYTIRGGSLKSPPLENRDISGAVPTPNGPATPAQSSQLMGYKKIRRTWFKDNNSGHGWHEDEDVPEQFPDGSYKSNPTSIPPAPAPASAHPTLAQEQTAWAAHLQKMGVTGPTGGNAPPGHATGANGPGGPLISTSPKK